MNKLKDKLKKRGMTQEALEKRFTLLRTMMAISIGIVLSIVIIVIVSDDPLLAIKYLLIGPLMSLNNFFSLFTMWIPIVITGLAVCIMFNANQFNLFAEGGFFFGAVVASAVALSVNLPAGIHPVVCVLAAAVVCGLMGAIPALMRPCCSTTPAFSLACLSSAIFSGTPTQAASFLKNIRTAPG